MGFKLKDAHTQAQSLLQAGDPVQALRAYDHILSAEPADYESRLKVADVLAQLGAKDAAVVVYRAVAAHDLRAGHPLPAIVALRAAEALGGAVDDALSLMVEGYAAGSPRLGKFAARQAPVDLEREITPPDFGSAEPPLALAERAATHAADLSSFKEYPQQFHPVPFFSELPPDVFPVVARAVLVRRLPDGELVIREGEPGTAFYLVASGEVKVFATDSLGRKNEITRLHENALFGEMALLTAQPRSASVAVVGEADILEIGREALNAIAAQLPAVATALDRFARERLLKNLLATSPFFKPFTRQQQMDLIKRFDGHDVAPGTAIINEGEQGQGLFIVLSGEVEVTKRGIDGVDVPLARLRTGDVFGEMSLLKNQVTSAAVRAARQSTVLFLARDYFQRLIEALPQIREYFHELAEKRDLDTKLTLGHDDEIEIDEDDLIMI